MSERAGRVKSAGHDDWIDALERGEGYYLTCPNDHGSLPPRRVCPHCGSSPLSEQLLPETGTIATHTTVHVAPPAFSEDAPYVTAVVDFGPVSLTGVVRGVETADVAVGQDVTPTVGTRETDGERVVVFEPV